MNCNIYVSKHLYFWDWYYSAESQSYTISLSVQFGAKHKSRTLHCSIRLSSNAFAHFSLNITRVRFFAMALWFLLTIIRIYACGEAKWRSAVYIW